MKRVVYLAAVAALASAAWSPLSFADSIDIHMGGVSVDIGTPPPAPVY